MLGIIQCAEDCEYQYDGYCTLETYTTVNSVNKVCPYLLKKSADNGNGINKAFRSD